jgi:uridine kinase
MNSLFVGIAGPSCSGKTTLIKKLTEEIGEDAEIIHADDYWNKDFKPPMINGWKNRELPENINFELLFEHLSALKRENSVEVPWNVFEVEGGKKIARPKKIIFVEGFLLFYWEKIRKLFDLKIYYDIDDKEIVRRRTERARSGREEREMYYRTVLIDEYKRLCLPTKKYADMILDGTNDVTLNAREIISRIATFKSVSE